jgi:hypothetical protein
MGNVREYSARHNKRPPRTPPAPQKIRQLVVESLADFDVNVANEDGWKKSCSSSVPNTVVCSRPHATSRAHTFRAVASLQRCTARQVREAFQFDVRESWDSSMHNGAHLKEYGLGDDDGIDVTIIAFASTPAAAGLISGRSFLNLDGQRRGVTPAADGGADLEEFMSSSLAAPADVLAAAREAEAIEWQALADAEGLVRATSLPGCGMRVRDRCLPGGERDVEVTIMATTEIGGMLPVSVVNNATPPAMVGLFKALQAFLDRIHGRS